MEIDTTTKKYVVLEHLMLPDRGLRFYTTNCHYSGSKGNNTHGFNGELWYKEVGFVDTHEEASNLIDEYDPSLLPTYNELYEYHKNKDIPNEIKVGDIVTPKQYPELKSEVAAIDNLFGEIIYLLKNEQMYSKDELEPKQHPLNGSQTFF